jgi:tRNA threonylcarbamoyl adenosine modification protein YeaZ
MITLAFDTCLDKMYAVLKKDGEILASRVVENHDNKYHSAFLISTLQEIMSENNIKPKDINLIATNIGPGSFTGIRACVTVARVMAQQLNCKAVGISSLEILAHAVQNPDKDVLVALDARKNSAYLYKNGQIQGAVLLDEIKTDDCIVLTDDKLQPILGGVSYQQENFPLGEILADLAEKNSSDGDWRKLKPLYIQPPPAMG